LLPRVCEQLRQQLGISHRQTDADRREPFAPPTFSQASGARSTAVRMPPSSSITFIRSSLQSVAKILPSTRNEGRPWWSCSTASGNDTASVRATSTGTATT